MAKFNDETIVKYYNNLSRPTYAVVNDKLTEFTKSITTTAIYFDEDGNFKSFHQDIHLYANDGNHHLFTADDVFYDSPTSFKIGNRMHALSGKIGEAILYVILNRLFNMVRNGENSTLRTYTYNKERMLCEEYPVRSICCIRKYNFDEGNECTYLVNGIDFNELDLYVSEGACYEENAYRKVDADGNETIVAPEWHKIKPTDEQMTILKQIKELMTKAKDAHVCFLYDQEDGCVMALNDDGLRSYGYDVEYDDEFDDEDDAVNAGIVIRRGDITSKMAHTILGCGYLSYDDSISIKSDNYIEAEKKKGEEKAKKN